MEFQKCLIYAGDGKTVTLKEFDSGKHGGQIESRRLWDALYGDLAWEPVKQSRHCAVTISRLRHQMAANFIPPFFTWTQNAAYGGPCEQGSAQNGLPNEWMAFGDAYWKRGDEDHGK
jgi:hypothetical protein